MPQPVLSNKGSSYEFTWDEYQLTAQVGKLSEGKDGTVKGELWFTTSNPEYNSHLLQQIYNFSSPIAQSRLKTVMQLRYKCKVDWDSVLEQISVITLEKMRQGEPVNEIWTDDKIKPPEYKLYPILPEGEPTLLFADGGSGKSYVSLFIATCIQLPWANNPLSFKPKYGNVLVLDWENGGEKAVFRLARIRAGHNLPEFRIYHRRCRLPLDKEIDNIVSYVTEKEVDTVIIDSAFGACNGDLNDNATAKAFFQAVAYLPTTTLILHHTAKGLKRTDDKTAYGSAYFNNAVRSRWEIVPDSEPDNPTLKLALFNRKSNDSMLHKPIGMEIDFVDPYGPVTFRTTEIAGNSTFEDRMPVTKQRIANILKRGPIITNDIAKELNKSYHSVATRLNEMRKEGKVLRMPDGSWGLVHVGN